MLFGIEASIPYPYGFLSSLGMGGILPPNKRAISSKFYDLSQLITGSMASSSGEILTSI